MNFILFPISEDCKQFWQGQKGYNFALDVYYVSNLKDQDIQELAGYLSEVLGDNSLIQKVVIEPERQVYQSRLNFSFNGAFEINSVDTFRTMKGCYLRIISAYKVEEHEFYIDNYIIKAVSYIRLKYGLGAALERADIVRHDLRDGSYSKRSDTVIPSNFGDGRVGNSFYENSRESGFLNLEIGSSLNDVASIFFDHAVNIANSNQRFLFLCIALESQIGEGKERQKFCENKLKSKIISDEMLKLFKMRHNIAHGECSVSEQDMRNGIPILLELLRLTTIQDANVLASLVSRLESELSNDRKRD